MRDIHNPSTRSAREQACRQPSRRPPKFVRRWLVLLPLCSCLGACALIHHDSPPAALIPPEQVRLADDIHLASEGWPSARWWEHYHEPQLNTLIDRAFKDAPTLAIASVASTGNS
jgi:multidrug efflux system outer membrane protein